MSAKAQNWGEKVKKKLFDQNRSNRKNKAMGPTTNHVEEDVMNKKNQGTHYKKSEKGHKITKTKNEM